MLQRLSCNKGTFHDTGERVLNVMYYQQNAVWGNWHKRVLLQGQTSCSP